MKSSELLPNLRKVYEIAAPLKLQANPSSAIRFTSQCPVCGDPSKSKLEYSIQSYSSPVTIRCNAKCSRELTIDEVVDAAKSRLNQPVKPATDTPKIESVSIASIEVNTSAQSRAEIDMALVAEYAESMREGAVFPPMTVFNDGSIYRLSEGFHRYHAYKEAGIAECSCIVKPGGLREAILQSLGSNTDHGKRRTSADKKRAVELMLSDSEWSTWSDREIAKQCAVTHPFVGSIRKNLSGNDYQIPASTEIVRTATRAGTTYTVNVANIGAKVKTDSEIEATQIRKDADAFIASKEETKTTKPDYNDPAYVKKAQDDASLDSFYKFSETAASFCNEKNAEFLKNLLIDNSDYYRDRWRRSVKDSISNVMTFLDNKHFYMKALDDVLFEVVPHYEKRETVTDSEELTALRKQVIKLQSDLFNEKLKTSSFRNDEQLQAELEKAQRSCKFWKTKIKDKEQRAAYERQEQSWREPKEIKFGDPEFLEMLKKNRQEQIEFAAKTYGFQQPMPLDVWRSIVQLTHPDKHGGSDAANRITQWLLKNQPPKLQETNDKDESE